MIDPEVNAIDASVTALEPLDEHVRRRVLRYLLDRYAYAPPAAVGTKPVASITHPMPDAYHYAAPDRRCLVSFGLLGPGPYACWRERGHAGVHASPHTPFTGANDGAALAPGKEAP